MRVFITSDANSESGVGEIVDEISDPTKRQFATHDYGNGLLGVVVVLMCRNPELNFKRRLRFARKEKKIFLDVMLDLNQMQSLTHEKRRQVIIERIGDEVPEVLSKYPIDDFDKARFLEDFRGWLTKIGKAPESHSM